MTEPDYYRDPGNSKRFYYLAGAPTPERGPTGKPTLSLWVTDNNARLQLGVKWWLSAMEEDQLRRTIAMQHLSLRADEIELRPAPVHVQKVELRLSEEVAEPTVLATCSSSGFPPYTALFATDLTQTQKNQVIAALHGRQGLLTVRYTLQAKGADGSWQNLQRQTDIADWFTGQQGHDHIRLMPTENITPQDPAPSGKLAILAPNNLDEAPIAFIELRRGDDTVVMQPPDFASVELPAVAENTLPLRFTTHYTLGPEYVSEIAVDLTTTYEVTPADLGLALVTLSAPTHQYAQAREVRIHVRYLPTDNGETDERTIYLRGSTWQTHWWLITRGAGLQGELEVAAKVTQANGAVLSPPRYRQTTGEIVIQ